MAPSIPKWSKNDRSQLGSWPKLLKTWIAIYILWRTKPTIRSHTVSVYNWIWFLQAALKTTIMLFFFNLIISFLVKLESKWSFHRIVIREQQQDLNPQPLSEQSLNHITKLATCLCCVVSTYLYSAFDGILLSCHIRVLEWICTLQLPECWGTSGLKQALYLKFKW